MQFPSPSMIERPFTPSVENERVNERIRLVAALRQRAATVRAEPFPDPWFQASQHLHEPYILEKVAGWIEKSEI